MPKSAATKMLDPALILRRMTALDLEPVLEIEAGFTAPWSREMFLQELRQEEGTAASLVAEIDGRVVGYILWWFVADEVHIVNLAVHAGSRRRGLARRLLDEVFRRARTRGMAIATLEVRFHNTAAIQLYEGLDFRKVAIRKAYYADNGEDALVMLKVLETQAGPTSEPGSAVSTPPAPDGSRGEAII